MTLPENTMIFIYVTRSINIGFSVTDAFESFLNSRPARKNNWTGTVVDGKP